VEGLGQNDLEPKVHCVEPTVLHGMVVEEGNDLVRVSKDFGYEFVVHCRSYLLRPQCWMDFHGFAFQPAWHSNVVQRQCASLIDLEKVSVTQLE